MTTPAPPNGKWRRLFALFLPIFVSQTGQYAMNFVDVAMSGHASAEDLAGVAIGSSLWVPVWTGVGGILLALSPIVSHHLAPDAMTQSPAPSPRRSTWLSRLLPPLSWPAPLLCR